MKILGIIPARYASTRFPGKPLADISGKSMIHRVYEQCTKAESLLEVIVATDDDRIASHVNGFGGNFVMTSVSHKSGTERCAEAMRLWKRKHPGNWDAVINIQCDEPFIAPNQIELVGKLIGDKTVSIATLVKKIQNFQELSDPNVVKVVLNRYNEAMYFSRSPIPYLRDKGMSDWIKYVDYFKHIGIYGYQSDILERLPKLDQVENEMAESLEQIRWLSYGLRIKTAITEIDTISIDTPSDLSKITNIT
jgi:3-deoxy-manno-octulosonate cytidylyltransferase (CMP-KDO synthetase)